MIDGQKYSLHLAAENEGVGNIYCIRFPRYCIGGIDCHRATAYVLSALRDGHEVAGL